MCTRHLDPWHESTLLLLLLLSVLIYKSYVFQEEAGGWLQLHWRRALHFVSMIQKIQHVCNLLIIRNRLLFFFLSSSVCTLFFFLFKLFLNLSCRFFSELNTKIFQTLLEVASSVDRALTEQHMQRMGLDPKADHKFLVDILETYGIDVMLMIDTSCCFWSNHRWTTRKYSFLWSPSHKRSIPVHFSKAGEPAQRLYCT